MCWESCSSLSAWLSNHLSAGYSTREIYLQYILHFGWLECAEKTYQAEMLQRSCGTGISWLAILWEISMASENDSIYETYSHQCSCTAQCSYLAEENTSAEMQYCLSIRRNQMSVINSNAWKRLWPLAWLLALCLPASAVLRESYNPRLLCEKLGMQPAAHPHGSQCLSYLLSMLPVWRGPVPQWSCVSASRCLWLTVHMLEKSCLSV